MHHVETDALIRDQCQGAVSSLGLRVSSIAVKATSGKGLGWCFLAPRIDWDDRYLRHGLPERILLAKSWKRIADDRMVLQKKDEQMACTDMNLAQKSPLGLPSEPGRICHHVIYG